MGELGGPRYIWPIASGQAENLGVFLAKFGYESLLRPGGPPRRNRAGCNGHQRTMRSGYWEINLESMDATCFGFALFIFVLFPWKKRTVVTTLHYTMTCTLWQLKAVNGKALFLNRTIIYNYIIYIYIFFFELMDLPEPAGITKGKQIMSWSPEQ